METINAIEPIRIGYPAFQAATPVRTSGGSGEVSSAQASAVPAEFSGWDSDDPLLDGMLQKIKASELSLSQKEQLATEVVGQYEAMTDEMKSQMVFAVNRQVSETGILNNRVFKNNFQEMTRYFKQLVEFDAGNSKYFNELKSLSDLYGMSA